MTKTELQLALAETTQTNKKTAGVFLDTLSALAYKEIKKKGEFVLYRGASHSSPEGGQEARSAVRPFWKLNQLGEGKYVRDRAQTFDVYIATI